MWKGWLAIDWLRADPVNIDAIVNFGYFESQGLSFQNITTPEFKGFLKGPAFMVDFHDQRI